LKFVPPDFCPDDMHFVVKGHEYIFLKNTVKLMKYLQTGFLVLLALAIVFCNCRQAENNVIIDGDFSDWQNIKILVDDPEDAPGQAVDLRTVKFAHDSRCIFAKVDFCKSLNAQLLNGTLWLLMDIDLDSATGSNQFGLAGTDAAILFSPIDCGQTPEPAGYQLRFFENQDSSGRIKSVYDVAFIIAPIHASQEFEFSFLKKSPVFKGNNLFKKGIRAKFVFKDLSGRVVDETRVFDYFFGKPMVSRDVQKINPLSRAEKTHFRTLSWNIADTSILENPQFFTRILRAVKPDIVFLDEVTRKSSASFIRQFLQKTNGPDQKWHVLFGDGGGYQRGVVAGIFPMRQAQAFSWLDYSPHMRQTLETMLDEPARIDFLRKRLDEGVATAGAILKINGRQVLAVSLDLQSRGRAGSFQDQRRIFEAELIHAAAQKCLDQESLDAVMIAGDFNLVGSRVPLEKMKNGLDFDGADLGIVPAFQLDGRSNITWFDAGSVFAPGRLDYFLYSRSSLKLQRSFVLDTERLSKEWLQKYKLNRLDSRHCSDHMPIINDFTWKAEK